MEERGSNSWNVVLKLCLKSQIRILRVPLTGQKSSSSESPDDIAVKRLSISFCERTSDIISYPHY